MPTFLVLPRILYGIVIMTEKKFLGNYLCYNFWYTFCFIADKLYEKQYFY